MRIIKTFENFNNEDSKEYTFDELSQEAKNHAIENERNSMEDTIGDWWYEGTIDEEDNRLRDEGLVDVEIQFSGFNSQGDGASFTGRVRDIKLFVKKTLGMEKINDQVLDNIAISIVRIDSRHVHENSVRFDCEVDGEDEIDFFSAGADVIIKLNIQDYCNKIEEIGAVWVKSRCAEIYKKLNKEYDSYFEEANIIEDIKANDLKFDEEGNII